MCMCRGVVIGGGMWSARRTVPPLPPHFNFQTRQSPTVSVSNVGDNTFYGCSEITRTRHFTNFTVHATIFGQLTHVFSNCKRELDHFPLALLEIFLLWAIRKKITMNRILNDRLHVESWTY